jgi:hypothetical protein
MELSALEAVGVDIYAYLRWEPVKSASMSQQIGPDSRLKSGM